MVTAPLGTHGILPFQRRVQQRGITGFDARCPSGCITQFGRTGRTRNMACTALRLEHLFTGFGNTVGIFDLHVTHFLDAGSHSFT